MDPIIPKESFPLTWPSGQGRTPRDRRRSGNFKVTFGAAREDLLSELRMLGAAYVVISSDAPTRRDGLPYADADPADPGAAVYFERAGKPYVIACDTYVALHANVRAIGLTVHALRTIERHGSTQMMEQAFTGFAALPPARVGEPSWWETLGVSREATLDEVEAAHQALVLQHHPDRGGDPELAARINRARDVAREERR